MHTFTPALHTYTYKHVHPRIVAWISSLKRGVGLGGSDSPTWGSPPVSSQLFRPIWPTNEVPLAHRFGRWVAPGGLRGQRGGPGGDWGRSLGRGRTARPWGKKI